MLTASQPNEADLASLLEAVLASARYRDLCPELVRSIGAQELSKRRNLKEAIKATKNKLHQVGGAYLGSTLNIQMWLNEVQHALSMHDAMALRETCRRIMSYHVSTRERLPILDQFYATLFADLGPIHSMLDLACGLNPLALPWMPTSSSEQPLRYYACDIYQHLATLHEGWFRLLNIEGHAAVCDILQHCPSQPVDVALLLKSIPCLEQINKAATHALLQAINARYLIISFPLRSLGGHHKGMLAHYEQHFRTLPGLAVCEIQRFEFATELVFVVKKGC